ncbi:interferon alpha/beta receptor 1-like isoform X3 [Alosa pseudoharengus]|uniref:interferon alpha/beta receptor 1-like isoform X3 n=1 Tax=Alosa pseudoharengus TaxID=34774 RepID=UPI003F8BD762
MNITGFFIFCAACTVLCRALEAPPPPYDVDLERNKALLKWRSSDSHNSTYTVQYQIGREDGVWHDLPGCVNTPEKQCDFSAMATHLYGATLQVRTQRHNVSSPWQQSKQEVGCVHTGSCSPEVVAMASPGYLSVQMDRERSDQSLQYEHAHLSYRVLYGREGGNMKVFCEGCVSAVRVEPLAVGERYCVQVRYLLYSKPYGSPSDPVCRLIPHSEREKELYLAVSLAAAFSVLVALSIGCYCFINRHYTHIKDYMRPPCSIPDHLIEHGKPGVQQRTSQKNPENALQTRPGMGLLKRLCRPGLGWAF